MTVTLNLNAPLAESSTRRTLADISLSVAKCKKIVIVTGAGISCSCGIPDFRSSDGLYALVKEQFPDVVMKGRDLFDASLFRDQTSTSVFYTFISQLKRSIDSASPAPTHEFIKRLDNKHKLLRSYTQNIDGLEEKAGLLSSLSQETGSNMKGKSKLKADEVRNIQLHGDIRRVRCTICSVDLLCTEEFLCMFEKGTAPDCPECTLRSEARIARSARPLKIGSLRPAIVLYDEAHPMGDDIGKIQSQDMARKPDMLIVMGTSLKVHGLKKLVKEFAKAVHTSASSTTGSPRRVRKWQGKVVFVNKTPPGTEWSEVIDYHIMGDVDKWVEKVTEDWRRIRPSDWEIQPMLDEHGNFKSAKDKGRTLGRPTGKSKQKPGVENALPVDGIPFPSIITKSASNAPSPSKRRQSVSHYSDLDSSPRKRRDVAKAYNKANKCLLFVDATNSIPQTDEGLTMDPFGSPFKHPGRRPRTLTISASTEIDIKRPRANSGTLRKKPWVEAAARP
ncbi:DHS-like NAD/FAD-binding domain-containing protein [Pisolithus croceorrhizus]|nr:DHS-like NAD/FAD-binding domain-containing protein [Pisolithus croceorrhizus]